MGKFIDLTGQTFGKLTVLYRVPNTNPIKWHCMCNCDNHTELDVRACHLRSGHTQSCGCYQKQRMCETVSRDLTNQKFGKLIAIKQIHRKNNNRSEILWECNCECGSTSYVRTEDLTSGKITSCGCSISKGEEKIANLLTLHNIPFEKQKTFSSCCFPDTKYNAYFDFYINNKYLIEFDGIQHFQYKDGNGWNNKINFEKTMKRDIFKNKWCKENNIPLIRIPYTQLDKLEIRDLLLETSSFIV